MSKYIIKNCPIIYEKFELDKNNVSYVDKYWCRGNKLKLCKNCTDCVLKQIVELCKEESSIIQHKQKVKVKGLNKLADRIFELLDIQEVE